MAEFDGYDSPYLFKKHMDRSQIVFERFSLVQSYIKDKSGNIVLLNADNDADPVTPVSVGQKNRISGESDSSQKGNNEEMKEGELRKKLKNMCTRPKRSIIPFLNEKSDVSLFTFLKSIAKNHDKTCPEEGCGKAYLYHIDYLYHGDGCV